MDDFLVHLIGAMAGLVIGIPMIFAVIDGLIYLFNLFGIPL
mgnify:CR=1 FL=1